MYLTSKGANLKRVRLNALVQCVPWTVSKEASAEPKTHSRILCGLLHPHSSESFQEAADSA